MFHFFIKNFTQRSDFRADLKRLQIKFINILKFIIFFIFQKKFFIKLKLAYI